MEELAQFVISHADIAHWIVFGSLILAGFNIPISEDVLIVISAVLAATVIPENVYKLLLAVFLGCCLGDWICYAMGRFLGPNLWKMGWFAKWVQKERVEQIAQYYAKYGVWTLIIGRFIPFGVRNGLFLAAGLGKMPFARFACSDGFACMLSNSVLFSLIYFGGKNYQSLLASIKIVNIFLFTAFAIAVIAVIWYKRKGKTAA